MDDLIRKADVYKFFDGTHGIVRLHVADVDAIPVVNPESLRPQGYWVYDKKTAEWGFPYICMAEGCGKAHNFEEKFCPNCGAKMKG